MQTAFLQINVFKIDGNLKFGSKFTHYHHQTHHILKKQKLFQSLIQLENWILYSIGKGQAKMLKDAFLAICAVDHSEAQTGQFSQLAFKLRDFILQILAEQCKFLTKLAFRIQLKVQKLQAADQNQSKGNPILPWKFLKSVTIGNIIKNTEFKQLFTSQLSYLQVLDLRSTSFDNNLMRYLSKFKCPSLKQLAMITFTKCTADGLKLLHKQCHYKLHTFFFCVRIPSLLAFHCIGILSLSTIKVFGKWPQNKSIKFLLVLKQLVKTQNLLQKHLKHKQNISFIDQIRQFISQYIVKL